MPGAEAHAHCKVRHSSDASPGVTSVPVAFIQSPPSNGLHVGPLFFHAYYPT